MDKRTLLIQLAEHIRRAVLPHVGSREGARVTGSASSGDATFAIDLIAEQAIDSFAAESGVVFDYYSEDRGLVRRPGSELTLVIDPIDGTRPAAVGQPLCVVSVAATRGVEAPTFADVLAGYVLEILGDRGFFAERGAGAEIVLAGGTRSPSPRQVDSIDRMAWSTEIVARPARWLIPILAPMIDASSMRGGLFIWNSTAYSLTRLVAGQLDACVDVGGRLLVERPQSRDDFLAAGGGRCVGLFAYDVAAAKLIAEEAGCIVTDASGRPLDARPLLDTSEANILSCVAATNADLHAAILAEVNRGFAAI
jgi:myo-inositol-1(or 4)-monophosphatase